MLLQLLLFSIAWNNKFFVREWGVKLTIKNTWKGCSASSEKWMGFYEFFSKNKTLLFTPPPAADCRSRIRARICSQKKKVSPPWQQNWFNFVIFFSSHVREGKNLDNTKREKRIFFLLPPSPRFTSSYRFSFLKSFHVS